MKGTELTPRFLSTDTSLSALLIVLLLLIFVFYPLGQIGVVSGVVVQVLFSLMVISGVTSLSTRRWARISMGVIAFATILSAWLALVHSNTILLGVEFSLTALFLACLVVIVLFEVFRDGPITSHRVQGAIATYLLIGILWAILYRLVELFAGAAFQRGPGSLPGPVANTLTRDYVYFSFGSLTTVGYAGLIPIHPVSLSLVMFEALIGQLFPAILLARLVSMEVSSRLMANLCVNSDASRRLCVEITAEPQGCRAEHISLTQTHSTQEILETWVRSQRIKPIANSQILQLNIMRLISVL